MKKRNVFISASFLALAVVTLAMVHSCRKSNTYEYETVKVTKGSIVNEVTATGTLEAITSVVVGTQVSGIVEKLYVDFNSVVKKGQVLAELDKTALKSSVQQSLASLDNSKAEMEYQASNYERSKALWEKNLIAEADYDQAKYNYDRSVATLKNSQAQYDKSLVQLGYATIYSPIDGVVMNRAVDEGQTVAASFNTPEIFTIAQDLTQMQVEADINESDIGIVRVGQRVEFDVDAYPGEKFGGTVEQIRLSPVTTSTVVTYTVIINAPNPDQKLLPGMTANIIIYAEEHLDVLTLPYKAIKFKPDAEYLAKMAEAFMAGKAPGKMNAGAGSGSFPGAGSGSFPGAGSGSFPGAGSGAGFEMPTMVWIRTDDGIRPVPVKLGSNDGINAEVVSGLAEGDEVVVKMTVATAKVKKEKQVASNPFMPAPPGRRATHNTTRTGTSTSTRTQQ